MVTSSTALVLTVACIVFAEICVSKELPPNLDKHGYCELCNTAAAAVYESVRGKKVTLYEAWHNLCTAKNFASMKNYKMKDLINGCTFLIQPTNEDNYEMYEMVRQLLDHDASVRELKSSMCHMSSDACQGTKKKISDVDSPPDLSVEEIQKILQANDIKRPHPVRPRASEEL